MSQDISVFRPSALRCFVLSMIAGLLGGGLAALLLLVTDAKNMSITGSMIGFLLGTLLTLRYRQRAWSIIITDVYVSGPSAWWGGKVVIPFSSLDRNSQGKESFLVRLLGEKYIHSMDGKKIRIEQKAFNVEQIREMQDLLDKWQSSYTHNDQAPT